MKRLNPTTGLPFKRGNTRFDGKIFKSYNLSKVKKDGFFIENWVIPAAILAQNKYNSEWKRVNFEKHNAHVKLSKSKNPEKYEALKRKYKANKLQRIPPWLSNSQFCDIEIYYKKARKLSKLTGVQHHVDHIIPLLGKNVCGLHVPWNLQILTASQNCSKSNRVYDD